MSASIQSVIIFTFSVLLLTLVLNISMMKCKSASSPRPHVKVVDLPLWEAMNNITRDNKSHVIPHIKVVDFRIHHLEFQLTLVLFILAVVGIKILLHKLPHLSSYVPESCILLLLGILAGFLMSHVSIEESVLKYLRLDGDVFFFLLLPPIVLEAAYGLHSRVFYSNIGTIIFFAVIGTIVSAALLTIFLTTVIRSSLVSETLVTGLTISQLAFFSSFIVAVDPVAVLAIFDELGVDLTLYFLIFGESLFNDAVTVVLYNIMEVLMQQSKISGTDIVIGVASFFTVSVGGVVIGALSGVLCCLLTRVTKGMVAVEPLVILLMAYFSYVAADLFGWSGLVSLIVCGLLDNAYAFHNISFKSVVTVKRATKTLAQLSESIIFLFLGIELFVQTHHHWAWDFVGWALGFTVFVRAIVIFFFCFLINMRGRGRGNEKGYKEHIAFSSQVCVVWGGLRGAVAYALAAVSPQEALGEGVRDMFLSTTLVIVLFTNLIMGTTMKPLVKLMQVKRASRTELCIFKQMNYCLLEHLNTAVEEITGMMGSHQVMAHWRNINDKVIRPILLRDPVTHDEKIVRTYQKVSMALHMASVNPVNSQNYLNRIYGGSRKSPGPVDTTTNGEDQETDHQPRETVVTIIEPPVEDIGKESSSDDEFSELPPGIRRRLSVIDNNIFRRNSNILALQSLHGHAMGEDSSEYEKALKLRRQSIRPLSETAEGRRHSSRSHRSSNASWSLPIPSSSRSSSMPTATHLRVPDKLKSTEELDTVPLKMITEDNQETSA